jgi:hypothetical protein
MEHQEINSSGMSEEKLLKLCKIKRSFKPRLFWTAEIYGFGKYIRKYGYYPNFLPLAIYTDHGPRRLADNLHKHEIETCAPAMFCHNPESINIWKKYSKKPCYVLYSPFVFYRRSNRVVQDKNAIGTIVFPNHTVPDMDEIFDTQQYIDQLKNLPEKFQPISVCLHFHDIDAGRHKIYIKNNIPVYTAGHCSDLFIERFYEILKKFKYASSNLVSSSLFYSVEMGITFFIFGNKDEKINKNNLNYPTGKRLIYNEKNEFDQSLEQIFSGFDCEITEEKKRIVEGTLGIYDGVSRKRMAYILYTSLFKLIFSIDFYKYLIDFLIKHIFAKKNQKS